MVPQEDDSFSRQLAEVGGWHILRTGSPVGRGWLGRFWQVLARTGSLQVSPTSFTSRPSFWVSSLALGAGVQREPRLQAMVLFKCYQCFLGSLAPSALHRLWEHDSGFGPSRPEGCSLNL